MMRGGSGKDAEHRVSGEDRSSILACRFSVENRIVNGTATHPTGTHAGEKRLLGSWFDLLIPLVRRPLDDGVRIFTQ